MTKTKDLTPAQKLVHDAVSDLHSIWVDCVDGCTFGRRQEIDDVFKELGRLRIRNAAYELTEVRFNQSLTEISERLEAAVDKLIASEQA